MNDLLRFMETIAATALAASDTMNLKARINTIYTT